MAKEVANATQDATVELTDGRELKFKVTRDAYSKFIDESSQVSGKLAAMHSLLMRCADDDTKEEIRPMTANPANVTTLAGAVLQQYKPDIEIAVK